MQLGTAGPEGIVPRESECERLEGTTQCHASAHQTELAALAAILHKRVQRDFGNKRWNRLFNIDQACQAGGTLC